MDTVDQEVLHCYRALLRQQEIESWRARNLTVLRRIFLNGCDIRAPMDFLQECVSLEWLIAADAKGLSEQVLPFISGLPISYLVVTGTNVTARDFVGVSLPRLRVINILKRRWNGDVHVFRSQFKAASIVH